MSWTLRGLCPRTICALSILLLPYAKAHDVCLSCAGPSSHHVYKSKISFPFDVINYRIETILLLFSFEISRTFSLN
jgi:hypothetical protein